MLLKTFEKFILRGFFKGSSMNKLKLNYNHFEYRVLNFESQKKKYDEFIGFLKERKENNLGCEFEISGESLNSFKDKHEFEPKSIIVLFIPYLSEGKKEFCKDSNLSIHACSIDYHNVVKKIASMVGEDIRESHSNAKIHIQCDNGEYNERFFAFNSGLGKKGYNSLIINDIYGSYGFLALIFTDIEFEEVTTNKEECSNCGLCITHCPSGAISKNGINFNLCISYLTQKKQLSEHEVRLIKNQSKVYGCDVCQLICPENKNKKYSNIEDFNMDLLYNIDLDNVLSLSNKEFKQIYGNRNFSWRGKNIIKRNILILNDNE